MPDPTLPRREVLRQYLDPEPPEWFRNNPNYPYLREQFPPPPDWWRERAGFHRWSGMPAYPIPRGLVRDIDEYGYYREHPEHPGLITPEFPEDWRGDIEGDPDEEQPPDPDWAVPIEGALRKNLSEIFRRHLGAPVAQQLYQGEIQWPGGREDPRPMFRTGQLGGWNWPGR